MAKPRIIRISVHHWGDPHIICVTGKHHSKNAPLSQDKSAFFVGAGDRTCFSSRCLAAARSRSRENNTQLFSNTLATLRYPEGYAQMRIPTLAVSCQARKLNCPQIKSGTITANYTPSGNTQDIRRMVRIHFLCAKRKGSIQPEWVKLNLLAQREGFEPSCGVIHKLISSQPRYDRFDTSALI